MRDLDRDKTSASQRSRPAGLERMKRNLRLRRSGLGTNRPVKNVVEAPFQHAPSVARRIGGDAFLGAQREDPQIVDAVKVVRVKVGEPNRIYTTHTRPHELKAKLRWGVHQHVAPVLPAYESRMPGPLIPWVRGCAYGAATSHDRDAKGGACAKKGQSHATSLPRLQVAV